MLAKYVYPGRIDTFQSFQLKEWKMPQTPWVKRGLLRILLGLFLVFAMLTPFGDYLDTSLTLHMIVQHAFYLVGAFLITAGVDMLVLAWSGVSSTASRAYAALLRINAKYNKKGLVTFFIAGLLVLYWHLPANFDAAVLDEGIHILMHTTFMVVGSLLFVGSKLFTCVFGPFCCSYRAKPWACSERS